MDRPAVPRANVLTSIERQPGEVEFGGRVGSETTDVPSTSHPGGRTLESFPLRPWKVPLSTFHCGPKCLLRSFAGFDMPSQGPAPRRIYD